MYSRFNTKIQQDILLKAQNIIISFNCVKSDSAVFPFVESGCNRKENKSFCFNVSYCRIETIVFASLNLSTDWKLFFFFALFEYNQSAALYPLRCMLFLTLNGFLLLFFYHYTKQNCSVVTDHRFLGLPIPVCGPSMDLGWHGHVHHYFAFSNTAEWCRKLEVFLILTSLPILFFSVQSFTQQETAFMWHLYWINQSSTSSITQFHTVVK